jgi:hypothetical protein
MRYRFENSHVLTHRKVRELAFGGHLVRSRSHQARHDNGWALRYPTRQITFHKYLGCEIYTMLTCTLVVVFRMPNVQKSGKA